jgi:hypothetical protein
VWIVAISVVAACAGPAPQPRTESAWLDEDDTKALPSCHPRCVSGTWREADVRSVIYQVSRCSPQPVYASDQLRGVVNVELRTLSCSEALFQVAKAAGLILLASESAKDARGQALPAGAVIFSRGRASPIGLVDVKQFATIARSGTTTGTPTLEGEGWSREPDTDVSDEGSSDFVDQGAKKRSSCRGIGCGSAGDDQSRARRDACQSKCYSSHSICVSRCQYGSSATKESCASSCNAQQDSCMAPCTNL